MAGGWCMGMSPTPPSQAHTPFPCYSHFWSVPPSVAASGQRLMFMGRWRWELGVINRTIEWVMLLWFQLTSALCSDKISCSPTNFTKNQMLQLVNPRSQIACSWDSMIDSESLNAHWKRNNISDLFNTIIALELRSHYYMCAGVWFCSHFKSTAEFINGRKTKSLLRNTLMTLRTQTFQACKTHYCVQTDK